MAIVKFNGGNPVVLCSECKVIVRYVEAYEVIAALQRSERELCTECK